MATITAYAIHRKDHPETPQFARFSAEFPTRAQAESFVAGFPWHIRPTVERGYYAGRTAYHFGAALQIQLTTSAEVAHAMLRVRTFQAVAAVQGHNVRWIHRSSGAYYRDLEDLEKYTSKVLDS